MKGFLKNVALPVVSGFAVGHMLIYVVEYMHGPTRFVLNRHKTTYIPAPNDTEHTEETIYHWTFSLYTASNGEDFMRNAMQELCNFKEGPRAKCFQCGAENEEIILKQ